MFGYKNNGPLFRDPFKKRLNRPHPSTTAGDLLFLDVIYPKSKDSESVRRSVYSLTFNGNVRGVYPHTIASFERLQN